MVPASEMARIQADAVAAVCDKVCQVYRKPTTPDAYGSPQGTHALLATTVAGLTEPTATELQNFAYAIGDKAAWKVRMPIGVDVTHQDRLVIDGQTLEVHILLNPRSYEIFHSVIAAELK